MAYVTRYQETVSITVSGGVTHSVNIQPNNGGWLESLVVRNATALGISTAANILITQGGRPLWNSTSTGASNTTVVWYPRVQVHLGTTALTIEENATTPRAQVDRFAVAADVPINIQVASGGAVSGGNTRTVEIDLYISGN